MSTSVPDPAGSSAGLPGIVVSAEWLATHLATVVVADVRWYLDGRSGRAAFATGRLPGAVFVDLDTALSDPAAAGGDAGRHPLPTPEAFAAAMGALGIGEGAAVVAYDDSAGGTAGRLVWMLRAQGIAAALLDGGLRAWPGPLAADGDVDLSAGPPRPPATLTARPWPADRLATYADMEGLAGGPAGVVAVDARAADRYRGVTEPVDARPGHIPGARNLPWSSLIDAATGRFLPPDELRGRFAAAGVTLGVDVIASCGSGVSACADLIALEHAGLGSGRLFVPSWSGWASNPTRPAATTEA